MTTTIFHLMFTFIQIAFQISNGQWTLETSPPLPAPNFRIPIGYNPNTNLVWMVGGPNGANKIVSFNTLTSSYTDYGSISPAIHAPYGKMYTQINNILYFVAGVPVQSYTLYKLDLTNSVPSAQFVSGIPVDWVNYGCIAGGDNYIFVMVGVFAIYNINTNTWTNGPSSTIGSANMAEVTAGGYLYVIGGSASQSSIEKIYVGDISNIFNYNWVQIGSLSSVKRYATSVIYNQYVYVIGGSAVADGSLYYDTVDVIDTSSDTVGLSDSVYEPITDVAPVIVDQRIYAFGGSTAAGLQSYYQYYDIGVTGDPTSAPSNIPTDSPSRTPTDSPTYKTCDPDELDWDTLNTYGLTQTQLSDPIITSSWDAETLELNVEIVLEYITRSKYTFVDQYDSDRGITYVIDTEPFLSDGRLLSNPNNCENRNAESFIGKDWNTEYWSYLNREDGLNSIDYLEYGPSTDWTLNWDTECETVKYSKSFTFSELLACTDKINENTFVFVDNIVDDIDSLTLEGEFYVTIVSPLINQNNVAYTTDFGQYLTNTIANYPVSISFPKKVASVRDPGVILFDISIFAIQYDEQNSKLLVDILSYSAEYINLINVNVITPTIGYDSNGVVNSITINEDDSYSGSECLFETTFQCFQKFQIEIDLSSCPSTSIDLSTTVILDSEPSCRIGEDCSLFESEFGSPGTKQQLNDNLRYIESCDTEIYIQTFEGTIKYFTDNEFTNEVDETTEFSIGSTLYVDVGVSDIVNYGVFSIDVLNVWICTTSASLEITNQLTGEGGCIENYESNNNQGLNIDEIFQPFKNGVQWDTDLNGQIYETTLDESVRFSLLIPSFQRNKFWLHAIVELKLENNLRRRARLLLTVSHNLGNENNNDGDTNTVNRLSHYIKDVTIVNDVIKTTHGSADTTKQEADSSVSYYSYVMHAICFFTCLFV
eukprot:297041_1